MDERLEKSIINKRSSSYDSTTTANNNNNNNANDRGVGAKKRFKLDGDKTTEQSKETSAASHTAADVSSTTTAHAPIFNKVDGDDDNNDNDQKPNNDYPKGTGSSLRDKCTELGMIWKETGSKKRWLNDC